MEMKLFILIYIIINIGLVIGEISPCPNVLLCLLGNVLGGTLTILGNTVYTITGIQLIQGDLECNSGGLNILGILNITGRLITKDGCTITVKGASSIFSAGGSQFENITFKYDQNLTSPSSLTFGENVNMSIKSLQGLPPVMVFNQNSVSILNVATVTLQQFQSVTFNQPLGIALGIGISFGRMAINSAKNVTSISQIPISQFEAFDSVINGMGGQYQSVNINKSTIYLDHSVNINNVNATNSNIVVMNQLASIGSLFLKETNLNIISQLLLNQTLRSVTSTISNVISGGGSLILNNGSKITLDALTTPTNPLRIDAQITSLGGILESIPPLQLVQQLTQIENIKLNATSYLLEGTSLGLKNSQISLLGQLKFVVRGTLSLVNSVVALGGPLLGPLDDILLSATDLILNQTVFRLVDSVLPNKLVLDTGATLSLSNGVSLDLDTSQPLLTTEDSTYTVVYSEDSGIECDNTTMDNSTSPDYQFACDNKMLMVRFANCSRYTCPNETRCVDSPNNCPDSNGLCTTPGYLYQCWNGDCNPSISECPPFPSCLTNQTRCPGGECVYSLDNCTGCLVGCPSFKYFGCPLGFWQCESGECVKDLVDCKCSLNCSKIPIIEKVMETKTPVNTSKDFVVPLVSKEYGQKRLSIYGYVTVPKEFYSSPSPFVDYIHVNQADDSFLDSVVDFWTNTSKTYRNYLGSVVYNITLDNHPHPIFSKPIQFELKLPNFDITKHCLAFINETNWKWQCLNTTLYKCGPNLNNVCGKTDHFTNFGALVTYRGEDEEEDQNSEVETADEKKRKLMMNVILPAATAGGAVVVIGSLGFIISKVVKHGKFAYWLATKTVQSP